MKKVKWILIFVLLTSCRNRNEYNWNYYELAIAKKMSYADSNVSPIDEKIIEDEIMTFTDSLSDNLDKKIIRLYRDNRMKLSCLPKTEQEFYRQKAEWEKGINRFCDSSINACGSFYYCDVDVMRYCSEQTRNRIRTIEACLKKSEK